VTTRRIHVTGASGVGVTTLGRALADALAIPHHDTDDYYWLPTSPPFMQKRDIADGLRLMHEVFLPRSDWVVSGSLDVWGAPVVPLFDLVVFIAVPADVRLKRLRDREVRRFGAEAIAPGGWRHQQTTEFLDWASHYDDGTREGRSLARHEAWLRTLACPVIRLDGTRPIAELASDAVKQIDFGADWIDSDEAT